MCVFIDQQGLYNSVVIRWVRNGGLMDVSNESIVYNLLINQVKRLFSSTQFREIFGMEFFSSSQLEGRNIS